MAKYCGHCGAELDGDERVCGQCGTPLQGAQETRFSRKVNPATRKKRKRIVKTTIIVAVIVAVAAIAGNVAFNYVGNRGLVHKIIGAYEKYDIDAIVSYSSDIYYYSMEEDAAESYFTTVVGNDLDYFDAYVGHNYKLTYKINEVYTLSERKRDVLFSDIEYMYPSFDINTISTVAVANVSVTAKQGKSSTGCDLNLTMTKENGEWKILYIESGYDY